MRQLFWTILWVDLETERQFGRQFVVEVGCFSGVFIKPTGVLAESTQSYFILHNFQYKNEGGWDWPGQAGGGSYDADITSDHITADTPVLSSLHWLSKPGGAAPTNIFMRDECVPGGREIISVLCFNTWMGPVRNFEKTLPLQVDTRTIKCSPLLCWEQTRNIVALW